MNGKKYFGKMKEELIEQAARELCTNDRQEQWVKDFGTNCFIDGARWRIDAAWHEMSEKPNGLSVILVDFGGDTEEYSFGITLDGVESAKRWAYVDDLLPERKEDAE